MKIQFTVGGSTLVLNADGKPLSLLPIETISWQDSVKGIYGESVTPLHHYKDWFVRSPSTTIQIPSVVILKDWIKIPQKIKYTRHNLYLRDNYQCQYCGEYFARDDLTIEHVIAKKNGGKNTWENTAAACKPCNNLKGHKDIMKPMRKPFAPSYWQLVGNLKKRPIIVRDPVWNQYLNWDEKLVIVESHNKK